VSGERVPFSVGVVVLGGGAALLMALLAIGFLLPTHWEADAATVMDAAPGDVFEFLDSPEGWQAWTPWPDSGLVREGPQRGVDAGLSWDDRELGSGRFRLVAVQAPERVAYEVEVSGGAMRTEGTIALVQEGNRVLVAWHEEGHLGRNPLMGYWALFMNRAQTAELEKGLDRLRDVVTGAR
jgi:hypothetical protein